MKKGLLHLKNGGANWKRNNMEIIVQPKGVIRMNKNNSMIKC